MVKVTESSCDTNSRPWLRRALFHLSFITATILGQYARAGTTELAIYSPSYVVPGSILWSNLAACLVMGLLQELNVAKWFAEPELKSFFTTLTTGFCGAYSSYSTLMLETFQQSTSLGPANIAQSTKLPNRAYGIMEFLAVLLTQLFVSMGAYLFGRGLGKSVIVPLTRAKPEHEAESEKDSASSPQGWVIRSLSVMQIIFALLAVPLLALIIVLTCVYGNYSRGKWTLPALFAVFAGYLRYELSNWLNGVIKTFPMGTFVANEFAVLLIAVFQLVMRGRRGYHQVSPVAHTINSCHVTNALISGFCGTLSTTSTFINEGYKLEFVHMLLYYLTTTSVSYCLLVIILGSYAWTRGLTTPLC
ncbi:hypothetical protein BZL39_C04940 [Zygosaccharomyces parabailii]|uniref:BN860_08878g1_1 n=1 Tax=Zygosaccharomyces bailii (strain CLIB 213 / ATCC 58445 / CBS 680 / BCRC 21525 / NBRC 1098 / NCYC 1416 / NRRL Y-2227) TaxID=1333698 RepID=A0A8J2X870_ZYGB2|nr:hypothetical protein BZL39_C04940 [Zygosaccharomyces parabailii]CDF87547.1 BN860_08878g1_1 [Zygosaccharomyces bailii CLIB 213]CDH15401.1 related to UPF0695 membrane protein YOR390W [Zygosaccharomyces bailii ISA1307]